ncbi:MAG: ribosome silencing factor [Culicoidibacterales bacterium]
MNENLKIVIDTIEDKKVPVMVSYDVRGLSTFADVFVIAIASNDRQINGIMQEFKELAINDLTNLHVEGDPKEGWVAIQYFEICAHIFLQDEHLRYRLDELFETCPIIE